MMNTDVQLEAALSVRDLAVSFDNGKAPRVQAVSSVNLTLFQGQTVAVVGESGCGKSVTALSALRLLPTPPARIDCGSALLRRRDGSTLDLAGATKREMLDVRGGEIAMIFQEPMTSLNPVFTIGDQLIEAIRLHRKVRAKEAQKIAEEAMDEVGITDPGRRLRAYPHEFSGGMRQRAMIAMALACRPTVLIADEPTTALDVTIQAQILELLAKIQREREMAVLLITHDLGVVAENADAACVMYAGRVVEYARIEELFEKPLHPYTRGLLASIPTMDRSVERLTTIDEVIGGEGAFGEVSSGAGMVTPWWPGRAPAGMAPIGGIAGDYVLAEVEPEHWVGVWRTESVAGGAHRAPVIGPERVEVGAG